MHRKSRRKEAIMSLYSEMHDLHFCMEPVPSEFEEGEMVYCGMRIPMNEKMCDECTEKAKEKEQKQ
jgi:hypothetical protein